MARIYRSKNPNSNHFEDNDDVDLYEETGLYDTYGNDIIVFETSHSNPIGFQGKNGKSSK